jgi:outer membrane biosynthesis protein TonB
VTSICRRNPVSGALSRLATVRRPALSALALALGAIAVPGVASCGGEDAELLPGETAREITENLDRVRAFAGEGECVAAANTAQEVDIQVESLQGVDPKLKRALEEGTVRLDEAIASCEEAPEPVRPIEETTTEERTPEPSEKEEKKREKELEKLEKEEEKAEKEEEKAEEQEVEPPEEAPEGPPETVPPSEGGGTGAPGGVGPGSAVGGE